ncbi:hypothetical protein VKT23_016089 [Stygiomarasmius scandens]|uniref:Cytochrome P450 n=1 Tax=Marasmiellus scandens TaxID=2682957 RepID=A0ABR1IYL9_9AGAR
MLSLLQNKIFRAVALSAVAVVFLQLLVNKRRKRTPLPPGPRGLPIIGNLLDVPSSFEWLEYMKWSQKYNSDIVSFAVAGASTIILNSQDAVTELMEKRSRIYSSSMGWSWTFVISPYGPKWNERRTLFVKEFNSTQPERYQPQELKAVSTFLENLIHSPDVFVLHLRHMAGSLIMSATYGIEVAPRGDPYVISADRALDGFIHAAIHGTFWVDYFPFLKYVPSWIPGASFQRKAKEWKEYALAMVSKPYQEVKSQMANGVFKPCFVYNCLQNVDHEKDVAYQEKVIQETAGSMYFAGTDTTVTALHSFFLAMVCNPTVQKKAQEELDRVVGYGRLPNHSDEADLPYITAIMYEVLRQVCSFLLFQVHLPTLIHQDTARKPTRAILHDENLYPDPDTLNPSRWLTSDGKINTDMKAPLSSFGFGRRVCPGMHMALSSIWMTIASTLLTFDISEKITEDGEIIKLTQEYESSLQNRPLPFACSINVRSKEHEKLIYSSNILA